MADTAYDFAVEGREEYLGATDKGFCEYVIFECETQIPEWYLRTIFEHKDNDLIELLRDRFCNDYLNSLEEANNGKI